MINLNGERGSGKTTQLIKLANTSYELGHNPIVIVPSLTMERFYKENGLNDNIAVITPKFYLDYKQQFKNSDIFIDEAEYVLKSMFNCGNLAVITTEKENLRELRRKDWDKTYLDTLAEDMIKKFKYRFSDYPEVVNMTISKAEVIEAAKNLLKRLEND